MKRPGQVLRELTQGVASLNACKKPLFALDSKTGEVEVVERNPKGTLVLLCSFSFMAGVAVGLWAAFPELAMGIIACVAVGLLALVYYTVCVMRHVRGKARKMADEKNTPSGGGCRADQSVNFWDL